MCDIYGIPNCDTMKKARKWLNANAIDFTFHDYRKVGVDADQLSSWVDTLGWEKLLNRRGLTWRKLSDAERADINRERAIALMLEYPAMIKRPLLVRGDLVEVGFSEQRYTEIFL